MRVELFVAPPLEFGFPPCLASLIVSEDADAAGFSARRDIAKLFNTLRPGGTLCLEMSPGLDPSKATALPKAVVKREGDWSLLVREGALPGAAYWTHEAADAACTFTSQDDLVKAPLGILWYGDEAGFARYKDYNHGVKPQVNGGRVYATAGRTLLAYDAYTGRPLWTKEFKAFRNHARFATMDDGIYLVADGKCTVYEPATGKRLHSFTFNTAGATTAKDSLGDDVVVVACTEVTDKEVDHESYQNNGFFDSRELVCLDRKTGTELWRRTAAHRFHNMGLAGGGLLFCIDSIPSTALQPTPKSAPSVPSDSLIWALDFPGRAAWSQKITYPPDVLRWAGDFAKFSAENGILLVGRKPHPIGLGAMVSASGLQDRENPLGKEEDRPGAGHLARQEFLCGDIADHGGNGTIHDILTGEKTGDFPFRVDGCITSSAAGIWSWPAAREFEKHGAGATSWRKSRSLLCRLRLQHVGEQSAGYLL